MDLIPINGGDLPTKFDPKKFPEKQIKLDAVIDYAAKVEDPALLQSASHEKVIEIIQFVEWWKGNITPDHGNGRGHKKKTEQSSFSKKWQKPVERWRNRIRNSSKFEADIVLAALRKARIVANENFLAKGTGKNEWYTPVEYIHATREVMGEIDLDPASSKEAQETIQARHYFTSEDDGLSKVWSGRVWLNPPYSTDLIGLFIHKLVHEISEGNASQAILLVHSYTDTGWFQTAANVSSAVCFARQRVKFYDPDGNRCDPTQGQAFLYFGDKHKEFSNVFGAFGIIMARYGVE